MEYNAAVFNSQSIAALPRRLPGIVRKFDIIHQPKQVMQPALTTIPTYNISDVNAIASAPTADTGFYVFRKDELPSQEKQFHPARSSHFTMYLHLSGEIEVKINLINYKVIQPCLFLVTPESIREKVYESADINSTTLGFTHDFLSKALLHKNHLDAFNFFSRQSSPQFLLTDVEAASLNELMLLLKEQNHSDGHPYKEQMIHHAFCLYMFEMARLARKYRGNLDPQFTRREDTLFRFIRLVTTHFKEERSVQFYADALFITPKHLTKTIKDITTKTCGEIINEMVITEAKFLLHDMTYSVSQVADKLHFSDPYFFSKFFKKQTGFSPKEYKSR